MLFFSGLNMIWLLLISLLHNNIILVKFLILYYFKYIYNMRIDATTTIVIRGEQVRYKNNKIKEGNIG